MTDLSDTHAPAPGTPSDPAPSGQPTAENARAQRAERINDPEWRTRYLNGDVQARAEMRSFNQTISQASAGDRLEAVLSGVVASNAMEVTTDTDFLTTRELASQVKSLRDSGLSDAVIRDVINGTPISQEQHDGFVRFKKRCLTDREWLIRYKSGDADAIADFRLFSAGVIAPVIGAKR